MVVDALERFLSSPSLADATRRAYRFDLEPFVAWLGRRRLALEDVDARVLAEYAGELGRDRRKLAPATIARKLAAVRSFLRHALGAAQVPDISLGPRRARRLPRAPRPAEVEGVLEALDGDGPLALRNRALLELVYSAGLRSREAVLLDLQDVDFEQEHVHVRGKGGKERIVPLGEEAAYWLARYLRDARPELVRGAENAFFVTAPPLPEPAQAAPRVRDAPARGRRGPAHDPGAARPLVTDDDAGVQPRGRKEIASCLRPIASTILTSTAFSPCWLRDARRGPSRRTGVTSRTSARGSGLRRRVRRRRTSSATSLSCARTGSRRRRSRGGSLRSARSTGTSSCSARATTIPPPSSRRRGVGERSRARSRPARP